MYEVYNELPFGVIIFNGLDFSIQYTNSAFLKIFRFQDEELEKSMEKAAVFNKIKDTLKGCFENKVSKKLRRVNIIPGKYLDFFISAKEDTLEIYIYDVTDYINEENKIKAERDKFLNIWSEAKTKCDILERLRVKEKEYILHLKNVVHNMSEGLIVFDSYGNLDFYNKSVVELSNLTLNQIENVQDFFKYIDENNFQDTKKSLQELYNTHFFNLNPIHNFIIKLRDKLKNDFKYVELNCNLVVDENKRIINTIVTMKDVTELKNNEVKLELQTKELERMAQSKDEFFNMISHELRTPLTIIQGSVQLANDIYRKEISSNIEKILSKVNQNCRILLKLINNILDVSKAEAGFLNVENSFFDVVSVTENIVDSANFYAKSKGVNLIFDTTEEEAVVNLDKDKYEKIILNLLSNAIKFTPEGKSVMITTIIEENYIKVKVKDEGIGIPKEKLQNIFDRFVQVSNSLSNNSQGTGLGLSLVKKFVELMKGDINVKSKLGEGTEFTVIFNIKHGNWENEICSYRQESNIINKVDLEFSDIN
ncbi:PAS domain-containing sensor histidine kinase [Clostridium sp.]|jgi:two-component system, OmpR family, phosphate regulon sensor histidine kinase PhoR|uniref:PAS domain-containing sensor histidine kinase n=1 Tax=Clostridium sp. TaxID=1506 RepID=UPI0039F4EE2F